MATLTPELVDNLFNGSELTIAEAKLALARSLGVSVDQIEIRINA
jgi:hypothetical protein